MKTYTIKVKKPFVCKTHGDGYWSDEKKKTIVKKINFKVSDFDFSENYISLDAKVFFTKKEWNTKKNGLIYTDNNWINDFSKNFVKLPEVKNLVKMKDIDYTEQGMQGDNYVSLSFEIKGKNNMKEFFKRIGSELNTKVIY